MDTNYYRGMARALYGAREDGTGAGKPDTAAELYYSVLYWLIRFFSERDPRFDAVTFQRVAMSADWWPAEEAS